MEIRISDLGLVTTLQNADFLATVQDGVTSKITGNEVAFSVKSIANLADIEYVDTSISTAIANLIDGAPQMLDTLRELALAMHNNPEFYNDLQGAINNSVQDSDFQQYFDNAFAGKNTYHLLEGSNLYYTEQRVLDLLAPQITTEILNVKDVVFTGTGAVKINSGNDLQLNAVGEIFINGKTTEQRVHDVLDSIPPPPPPPPLSYNDLTDKPVIADSADLAPGDFFILKDGTTVSFGQFAAQNITVGSGGIQIAGTGGVHIMGAAGATVILGGQTSGSIAFNSSTTGIDYNDLTNKPAVPTDINQLTDTDGLLGSGGVGGSAGFSGDYNDLTNKPAAQILQAPQWNNLHNLGTGNRYLVGDLVFNSGNIYQAIAENESQYTTVGDPIYWRNLGPGIRLQTDYLDLVNKPTLFSGNYADLTNKPTAPTYTSVTTTNLNVQNVTLTGNGPCTFTSGNDLNFVAAGAITFNGNQVITKTQLKSIVAASTDFADFKARIAAL